MTGQDFYTATRELLHDTGRGYASDNTFYTDDMIRRSATEARSRIAEALITQRMRARITVNQLLKTCPATPRSPMPDDFWMLECGVKANGYYVPRVDIAIGVGYSGTGHDEVWIQGQQFWGNAVTALYWAKPTVPIVNTADTLTDFSDSFYHAVKTLACRELIVNEQSDNADRWKYFTELLTTKIKTLR